MMVNVEKAVVKKMINNTIQHKFDSRYNDVLIKKCILVENCFKEVDVTLCEHFIKIDNDLKKLIFDKIELNNTKKIKEDLQQFVNNKLKLCGLIEELKKRTKNILNKSNISAQIVLDMEHIFDIVRNEMLINFCIIDELVNLKNITMIADKCSSEALSLAMTDMTKYSLLNDILQFFNVDESFKGSLKINDEYEEFNSRKIIYKRISGLFENIKHRLYDDLTYGIACSVYSKVENDPGKSNPLVSENQICNVS